MQNDYRQPNRLINEKSPYLLQHAYNPVEWYPWGEEAFQAAANGDKMVLLSIGYATCHWCHVMERESFEDQETADILNREFICIKVDREERPDIDTIYMEALHATGQAGGWPLNMFLTPDKRPVIGGTYFPPEQKYGINSFKEVLQLVSEAWRTDRFKMLDAAREITQALKDAQITSEQSELPATGCFEHARNMYVSLFDRVHYGFKTDARNKFPPSMSISFLLSYYAKTGDEQALEMSEWTLAAMKRGGIYDQIGGGLCRYSTDQQWLVPHFEKMLYDNSLFLKALAECYQLSGKQFYKQAAYDVVSYIERDMMLAGPAVASAEDADSEGEEGKFYLWSLQEFAEVTAEQSDFLAKLWNVTEAGNFEGENILNESIGTPPMTSEERYGPDQADNIRINRQKLLERRSQRPRPLRDDKVLTSWNCLYIRALARAGYIFRDQCLRDRAEQIYRFIENNMFDSSGRLLRRFRDSESAVKGYLVDYAEFGLASLALFHASSDPAYVSRAAEIADRAIDLFGSDFGAFYDTGKDTEVLLYRSITVHDGVEPSGNSSMARLLCTLANLGVNEERYNQAAERIFKHFSNELEKQPIICPFLLDTYMLYNQPEVQIVIVAKSDHSETKLAADYIAKHRSPDSTVVFVDPNNLDNFSQIVPVVQGKAAAGDFAAYVCYGRTCKHPVYSFGELKDMLESERNN